MLLMPGSTLESTTPHRLQYVALILIVAAAYAGSGRLGLLLAIPPGYATAVWPSSGIALAGILVFGYRVWPGIWLGSFLVNLWLAFDATQAVLVHSASVAAGIGAGATLQACLGAFLVCRFVGFPDPLNTERKVARFLVLGGPVSCLVGATLGNIVLLLGGIIPWAQVFFSWWTWWVGDTIGALVITPLLLIWTAEPRQIWRRRQISVGLPLCLTFGVVVIFFVFTRAREQERSALEFKQLADPIAQALRTTLNGYLDVLYAIEHFYAGSHKIERQEFHVFVEGALSRHRGIQALSWNPRVTDAERAIFEESTWREGYSGFQITEQDAQGQMIPAAPRPEYVPVYHTEPYRGNERALGFDVASDPTRREALSRARDIGEPMATGRITLVQEASDPFGIAVFLPIYHTGLPHETVAERRQNLHGYATGVFRIGNMIEAAVPGLERVGVEIRLYDDTAPAEERLLHAHRLGAQHARVNDAQTKASAGRGPQSSSRFDMAGRQWTLTVSPTPEYLASHRTWQVWTVLTGGLLFTALLGAFLLVVTGRSSLIEQLVAQRTAELNIANRAMQNEIAVRQQAEVQIEAALKEKTALLNEIHHRVKNNLQIISSLLNLQSAHTQDPGLQAALAESQGRVKTMALIHQLLYEHKDFSRVHLGPYLERLGWLLADSYGVTTRHIALRVEVDEVYLDLQRAVPCGLLVNELVTNAFKHAFPEGRDGEVHIGLREALNGEALLTVSDTGVGLPAGVDVRNAKSLGLQLVSLLADQIGGHLAVSGNPGARFELRFLPSEGG